MKRNEMINNLKSLAPAITNVTATSDMGYEFSAVVPDGVIYAQPGMLLSYSGGVWPLKQWEGKTDKEYENLLKEFLLGWEWDITPWDDLQDEDLKQWIEDANSTE